MKDEHAQTIKSAADTVSAMFTIGALLDFLPAIAAALSIIWYCIRFWEYFSQKIKERQNNGSGGEA